MVEEVTYSVSMHRRLDVSDVDSPVLRVGKVGQIFDSHLQNIKGNADLFFVSFRIYSLLDEKFILGIISSQMQYTVVGHSIATPPFSKV